MIEVVWIDIKTDLNHALVREHSGFLFWRKTRSEIFQNANNSSGVISPYWIGEDGKLAPKNIEHALRARLLVMRDKHRNSV